jgi:hypothetical protein
MEAYLCWVIASILLRQSDRQHRTADHLPEPFPARDRLCIWQQTSLRCASAAMRATGLRYTTMISQSMAEFNSQFHPECVCCLGRLGCQHKHWSKSQRFCRDFGPGSSIYSADHRGQMCCPLRHMRRFSYLWILQSVRPYPIARPGFGNPGQRPPDWDSDWHPTIAIAAIQLEREGILAFRQATVTSLKGVSGI